ncbi:(2Fe-2S)-binding protein [Pseudidiomarina taiwanensis]|uniref:Bacterioferritin-associated ferredoxin n=1 Tax=Pseudidiomarina taiwanensis TaxID=337250 RepID=A0A432ZCU8_9GAMM|nr:(2Fe-2S)-binding protein [Pseudidiomarina taiwanensis]RUO75720.1 hypothetical protein CWI83_10125 [Pseudidiomarina taiwanensis]
MYICICNAIREADVHAAVANDVRSFKELKSQLGLCSDCGQCSRKAKACFDAAKASQPTYLFKEHLIQLAQA